MGWEDTASRVAAVAVRVASLTGAVVELLLLLPALRAARVLVMPSATCRRSAGDALVLGVSMPEEGVGR